MSTETRTAANVQQAVPFFGVADMQKSLAFYREGLGFEMKLKWTPEGKVRWCWLELGGAALMLQEYKPGFKPEGKLGAGVSVCFICRDALAIYREAKGRGLAPERPFVGNSMWVTGFHDPDGYRVEFESMTNVAEGTHYSEELHG